ncbi:MAG TPA: lipopolysaccharide heptosyltransferase II [Gemmataceae bacterium]|jgi:heptosyltransferase-2|nr:lipopolysaccharide heptosyltransferase II [Gemmataceae bacterium]
MKIAVFWPNWIGDAVMATPAVRSLREHFPAAHFIGVLRPYIAGVLEGTPWMDRLVFLDNRGPWQSRWPAVTRTLHRERIDLAVLFSNSFRTAWIAWLARCKSRIGYRRYGRSFLLTHALPPARDSRGKLLPSPIIDAYNRLAEHAGCPKPSYRMELSTTPVDERAADLVWQQAGFTRQTRVVCLNPGAAFGSAKHWPAEYFAQLARWLAQDRDQGVLVLCGPGERDLARKIAVAAGHQRVHSLAEHSLSLGLTKACIRRSSMLVTTDSGPRHFAAAFARPVVTLFGPTHIAWTETYQPLAVHLQKKVDCGPCQRRVCPLDHRCMRLLMPAEVFEAVAKLLKSERPLPAAG